MLIIFTEEVRQMNGSDWKDEKTASHFTFLISMIEFYAGPRVSHPRPVSSAAKMPPCASPPLPFIPDDFPLLPTPKGKKRRKKEDSQPIVYNNTSPSRSHSHSLSTIGGWIINSSFTAKGQTDLQCCAWTSAPNPQTVVTFMSPSGAIPTQFTEHEHCAVGSGPEPPCLPPKTQQVWSTNAEGGKHGRKALLSGNGS